MTAAVTEPVISPKNNVGIMMLMKNLPFCLIKPFVPSKTLLFIISKTIGIFKDIDIKKEK